jgi:hypothetical protein
MVSGISSAAMLVGGNMGGMGVTGQQGPMKRVEAKDGEITRESP